MSKSKVKPASPDDGQDRDPIKEAIALIATYEPLMSTEEFQDMTIRVMRTGIAKTPQEKRILEQHKEFKARGIMTVFPLDIGDPMTPADEREEAVTRMLRKRSQKDLYSGMPTGTPSEFGKVERDKKTSSARRRRELVKERIKLAESKGSLSAALKTPYSGNPDQIAIKCFVLAAMLDKSPVALELKTGLVGSKDPVLQAAQAVGSYVTPGDLGRIRSPIRSIAARALTPGGGSSGGGNAPSLGRAIGRAAQLLRCPTGYQNGGRFTNRALDNCGQQIFDVPGVEAPGTSRGSRSRAVVRTVVGIGDAPTQVRRIGSGRYGLNDNISRMASVPHVGALDKAKMEASSLPAIAAAAAAKNDFVRLVRRDGISLQSNVPISKLASQKNNVDMQGGTIISRAPSFTGIGKDEVGLLTNGVASIRLVTPGGNEIRLDTTGNLSSLEASRIRREWGTISRAATPDSGVLSLQKLAEASNGKLSYSEKFNDIEKPNEIVKIERNGELRSVPRWAFRAYFADTAPGRDSKGQAWKEVGVVAQADDEAVSKTVLTMPEAVKKISNNGSLNEIPTSLLEGIVANRKLFTVTDNGNGYKTVVRKNGDRYSMFEGPSNSVLSEKVYSDIGKTLGTATVDIRLGESKAKRIALSGTPESSVPGAKMSTERSLADAKPADLLRIALTDYLLGREGRNPGSISILADGNKVTPVAMPFGTSGVNLTAAIVRKPQEILTTDLSWAKSFVSNPQKSAQAAIAAMYDDLLEAATSFDWEAYLARLGLSGDLSSADKAHLEILRRLYASRLDQLRTSKKAIIRIIGAS
jgi:hypothetical protein